MATDWPATGAMLQGWGTLIGAAAVFWAAKKGADTFDSWKRQKVAERKLEQAERVLTATYKARRALSYIRGVMMWGHELDAAEAKLKEDLVQWNQQDEARQKRLRTGQAYFNRLNKAKPEQDELFECLPVARALFGMELETALEKFSRQFWFVQIAVESYIDDLGNDADFTKQIRRGMYDVSPREGEVNEVTLAIAEAVTEIEKICLPSLR